MNARDEYLTAIEAAVGGTYRMADGRDFWMDGPVAREVAVRAADGMSAWLRREEPPAWKVIELEAALATAVEERQRAQRLGTLAATALVELGHDYMSASHLDRCLTCRGLSTELAAASTGQAGEGAG